jgi:O-antigen/teichoic acid export membrane protein
LTRWIGPHAYGLFVTVLGLTSFLAALTRGGIDTYLVRAEATPDKRTYDVATTLIGGLSLVLVIVGTVAVPVLSRWYGSREFVPAYLVTLLTIPLVGLAGPSTAKLERELNFRAVAGIELGGQALALLVSITLAWRGFGVWAPVTGLLVWQAWAAVGSLLATGLWPRPAFDALQARAMFSFGAGYSTSLRVWQLRALVNPLLVGRFAGTEGVAFVGLAIRIAEGLGFVRAAAGRLAIAALSRLRGDRVRFRAALEGALTIQVVALGPLLCLFALVAPVLVPRILGTRWLPSLRIYPFVATGVLVNSPYNLQASALFVEGKQWVVMRAFALHVVLLSAGTFFLLPKLGIAGYGWAELLACGGYGVLHAGLSRVLPLSYIKLGVLALVFLTPLFTLVSRGGWAFVLWLPLLAIASRAVGKLAFTRGANLPGPITDHAPPLFALLRSRLSRSA